MDKNIKELLSEATKGILTDESLKQIEEAFNASVTASVNEKANLMVESALAKQDEDYTKKLKKLLEVVDIDHTKKLNKVVGAINENHTGKLKNVVKYYQKVIKEDANAFKSKMINDINNYLELYIEDAVPKASIMEAVKNKQSATLINKLRNVLGVDLALATESIKEAVKDGHDKITSTKTELDKLVNENTEIKARAEKLAAELLLERKSVGLSPEKKKYMFKILSDKSESFITENFEYTSNLFDKSEDDLIEELKESASNTPSKTKEAIKNNVAVKKQQAVITESNQNTPDSEHVMLPGYMKELQKY